MQVHRLEAVVEKTGRINLMQALSMMLAFFLIILLVAKDRALRGAEPTAPLLFTYSSEGRHAGQSLAAQIG